MLNMHKHDGKCGARFIVKNVMEDKMKKFILFAVLLTFMAGAVPVFAQQQSAPRFKYESEYYYFNFPIEKIYAYRLGYIILYRKAGNLLARTFVPSNWFTDIGGKGEIVGLNSGKEWPSMTVYYKNGEFSHLRLRLRRQRSHETWGVVPLTINIDDQFKDIEEIKLEF
jgi:hypothetical protein